MGWFARLIGRSRRAVTMDGESVDTADDYIDVVRDIAAITGGILELDRVRCVEAAPPSNDELDDDRTLERDTTRVMTLGRGDRTWTGRLQGHTDWIDQQRLLVLMNRVLADLGAPRRLHAIHHPTWGQELGVVYARDLELAELRQLDYTIEDDRDDAEEREPETLAAERLIHGHLFPAGTRVEYWRDPPYDEMEVTLGAPHVVAGLALPEGTIITFLEEGEILCCVIAVDHATADHRFVAGTRVPFESGVWQFAKAETGY